ncbi:PAB-dependent poly(A)-specific ribonuclease subunit 3 [Steccherinum ochraceum]|uniref:PAN2-PAN3 deadenylation complex subunit PAN3 n=1 Tax=Steccherinum ochraceum TaxID=92696 RepID=A0A4R0R7U0_9APHY|nr:PAB-dependent poly(A)-specific ribonuclease subunit 3 [Steccherinum ochraceum]
MATGDLAFFSRPSSSAVRIVAPTNGHDPSPSPKPSPKKSESIAQRPCRNIVIYGSCKFQDKGCIYYHPQRDNPSPIPPNESPTLSNALPAQSVNAPVFVPKTPVVQPAVPATVASPPPVEAKANHSQSSSSSSSGPPSFEEFEYDPYAYSNFTPNADETANGDSLVGGMHGMQHNPYDTPGMLEYDNQDPMDVFYAGQPTFVRQPLNYHLYSQSLPENLEPRYFVSDDIREELQRRSEIIYTAPAPGLGLPDELQGYHSLLPLETTTGDRRKFGSWVSTVYRAISSKDGMPYVLRRVGVENFRVTSQAAFSAIEKWSRVRHPNIVTIREAFTTRAFGALVVVYDYHPNAKTLFDAHVKPKAPQFPNGHGRMPSSEAKISERTLWSYLIQIASALKAVHDAGLSMRVIDPSKVLITGQNRIRIGSCGIVDVLMHDTRQDVPRLQQEDFNMFGRLVFSLCCTSLGVMNDLQKAVANLGKGYSADIKNVALFLISKPGPHKTIGQLFDLIGSRLLTEFDESQSAADRLEGELMSELENGRLVRLLCKFGFINERPEFARDARWSETGDRYIIKLFRDYVFHQVDEHGRPVVNLSHVLTCLNKLDAGVEERIMLISRDEQSCLVVSYKEIKACVSSAFNELGLGEVG